MALRILKFIFGDPVAPTADPLLGAVLVLRRALGNERSHLDIQRMLYIAQVEHVGTKGEPIFDDIFNASSLGPIIPRLVPLLKRKKAIVDPVHETSLSSSMIAALQWVAHECRSCTSAQLVAITHSDVSGWANYYSPGACRSTYSGRLIPLSALKEEYVARQRLNASSADQKAA